MSDKDLQRVTESVSDIGQASVRRSLPARRNHITQKVNVAGQGTLSELIGLYNVIARVMSLALQYGASLEKLGDLHAGATFAPCSGTITLSPARVFLISSTGTSWSSTADEKIWPACHCLSTRSRVRYDWHRRPFSVRKRGAP
jgi:hypothetical protein